MSDRPSTRLPEGCPRLAHLHLVLLHTSPIFAIVGCRGCLAVPNASEVHLGRYYYYHIIARFLPPRTFHHASLKISYCGSYPRQNNFHIGHVLSSPLACLTAHLIQSFWSPREHYKCGGFGYGCATLLRLLCTEDQENWTSQPWYFKASDWFLHSTLRSLPLLSACFFPPVLLTTMSAPSRRRYFAYATN
jgi:hypothetical protein